MRRLIIALLALGSFALPLFVSPPAQAQLNPFEEICDGAPKKESSVCKTDGEDDPIAGEDGIILRAVGILAYIVGATAVIMMIIAGLKFITANGDPNSISSARNTVIYTLIGVAVFAMSNLIVRFVISRL